MSTTLILGAGASLANALHFRPRRQPRFRPPLDGTFFQTVRALGLPLTGPLRAYSTNVLQVDPDGEELSSLRMEEVFKDAFFDFQDAPSNAAALNAYIDLVDLYLNVLRQTTNWLNASSRTGAPIGRLLSDAAAHHSDVSVVTFNHDLVIENEIQKRASLRRRWCIDFGYGSIGNTMPVWVPRSGATFQRHVAGACDHVRPISVLKLHGSLNWVVRLQSTRPTASFLSGRSHRPMNLLVRRQVLADSRVTRSGPAGRGRSVWRTWPVVVPPVYAKEALRSAVHVAWDDARDALQAADRVVFFGYSLPLIDIEAEKLFQRALSANTRARWIDVINPDPASAGRYASVVRKPIRWYPSLDQFFHAGACA
jgi:hypothetical protein